MKCGIKCCAHNHSGRCDVRGMGRRDRPLISVRCQLAFTQRVGGDCDTCACDSTQTVAQPALVG